jgi:hypothetical protein
VSPVLHASWHHSVTIGELLVSEGELTARRLVITFVPTTLDQAAPRPPGETQKTVGDAVCADLKKGTAGANEVIGVANDFSAIHGSMSQANLVQIVGCGAHLDTMADC